MFSLVDLYVLVYEKRNIKIEIPLGGQPQKERNVGFLLFCLLGCLFF